VTFHLRQYKFEIIAILLIHPQAWQCSRCHMGPDILKFGQKIAHQPKKHPASPLPHIVGFAFHHCPPLGLYAIFIPDDIISHMLLLHIHLTTAI
jgi:hypothetical protein